MTTANDFLVAELEVLIGDRIDAEAFAIASNHAAVEAWYRSRM